MADRVGRDAFRLPDAAAELIDTLEAELSEALGSLQDVLSAAEQEFQESGDGSEVKEWLGRLETLLEDLGAVDFTPGWDA